MLHFSSFCMLLALAVAQSGYDYNRPSSPFGSGPSTNRLGSPGSSNGATTPNASRPQNDDFGGRTTGYPSGPQDSPSFAQRPGYPGSSYPDQSSRRPGTNSNSNYPQSNRGPSSSGYPGQSDSSYPQSRDPSNGFPGQGPRFPDRGQNYPGQPGSNFDFSDDGHYEGGDNSAIPGEPNIDYPILSYIPQTNFNCEVQQYPGYYSDVETRCQVFHVCANNKTYDFLCPNGTVFSQEDFVCVWWNQFECESAPVLYDLNAKLYDYTSRDATESPGYNDYPGSNYPGRGSQGKYPGSESSRSSNNYPNSLGTQGPTTTYPSITGSRESSGYPGQSYPGGNPDLQGPSNYPKPQDSPNSYPGSQGPSLNYPEYPNYSQNSPEGSGSPGTGYPSSSTPYPGINSRNQGYPSGSPNGIGFPDSNGRRQPQKPSREYLPPRNKRTKQSRIIKSETRKSAK